MEWNDHRWSRVGAVAQTVFFPLSIVSAVLLIAVAWYAFGTVAAIKGSYTLFGLLVGASIFYSMRRPRRRLTTGSTPRYEKAVYILALLAVSGSAVLNDRLIPLLTLLPFCYVLLVLQLRHEVASRRLLPQIVAVFAVTPITKYLTTGFYFGGGDTFTHVRYVDQITAYGTIVDVTEYRFFPVMHTIASMVSETTGLTSYDGIQLLGIVASVASLLVIYLIARATALQPTEAIYLTAAVTLVEPIFHYASYFFPQSLAVILFFYLIYLAYRLDTDDPTLHRRFVMLGFSLAIVAVLTHHLTFLLFIPLFFVLLCRNILLERVMSSGFVKPHLFPLSIAYAIAFTYWTYHQQFIESLFVYVGRLLEGRVVGGEEGGPMETVVLGGQLQESTPASALWSLVSAEGIYFMGLVALFSIGVAAFLKRPDRQRHRVALIVIGIASAIIVLRTPLAHPDIDRLRHPLGFFFAFVLGIGLFDLLRSQWTRKTTVLIVTLVVLLGTLAPLIGIAGDDLYEFDDGESLYQLYSAPEPERDIATGELHQLEHAFAFTGSTNTTPSSLHLENNAMDRYGVTGSANVTITDDALRTDTPHFLYRTTWNEHRNTYTASEGGETLRGAVVFEDAWLTRTSDSEHKVYTTGNVGILYAGETDQSEYSFSPDQTRNRQSLDSQSADVASIQERRLN